MRVGPFARSAHVRVFSWQPRLPLCPLRVQVKGWEAGTELTSLRSLRLGHNPVSQSTSFRSKVIVAFPTVTKLDGQTVTPKERKLFTHQHKTKLTK